MNNDGKELAAAIRELAKAHGNGMAELSASINHLAHEVHNLGNAGAITATGATMGAMEYLAGQIHEGASSIASAIGRIADRAE